MTNIIDEPSLHRRNIIRRAKDKEIMEFQGCPKYLHHDLSDAQIALIVSLVTTEYTRRQDEDIGKLTKKGLFYVVGMIGTGLMLWLNAKGFMKFP